MNFRNLLIIVSILALLAGRSTMGQSINLRDVDGAEHRQAEWAGKRAVVIFFTTTECPSATDTFPR